MLSLFMSGFLPEVGDLGVVTESLITLLFKGRSFPSTAHQSRSLSSISIRAKL